MKEQAQQGKQNQKRYKSRGALLAFFLKGSRGYLALSVVMVCVLVGFELVNPKILGYTVDLITGDISGIPAFLIRLTDRIGGREMLLQNLWIPALIVVGIALLGAVSRYAFQMCNGLMAETLVKRMRDTLYEQIMHLPYRWYDSNQTGDIIQRMTSDVNMIRGFLCDQLTNLFRILVLVVLSMIMMLQISPLLTGLAALFIPVAVGYSMTFHKRIGSAFFKIDTEEGKLSSIAQENIAGLRVVRAFGREKYERDRFETQNEGYTGLWVGMMKLLSGFWSSMDVICGLKNVVVLSVGVYLAVQGRMTAGDFVAFITYSGMIDWPIRELGRVISELSKAGVSIDRLLYIMNADREEDAADAVAFPDKCDIDIRNLSFSYTGERKALQHINMHIAAGETIGILGATGSGKSTLTLLIDGLYEQQAGEGSISIGGVDIRKMRKSDLRHNIGLVLQETYLFSRSLADNIRIAGAAEGGAGLSEDVIRAVETASLTHTIERFVNGYDTYVGEKGVTLSGGQKQRTAIARNLVRHTPIMIYDDSLSAVDAETDAQIRASLQRDCADATVILISHRITTLMKADHIYVLDDGGILEEGSHEELLAAGGRYRQIYDLQLKGGETE